MSNTPTVPADSFSAPRLHTSMHRYSYFVALGGILSALSLASMFIAVLMPFLYLIMPMVASCLIYIMAMETTPRWSLLTYAAVSVLSLFIAPNKSASLVFILFFGYYPLLRMLMNRWHARVVAFIVRLAIYNAAVLAYFYGSVYLLGAEDMLESLGKYGRYGGWILLALANITFLCFDYIMSLFPEIYRTRLKARISPTKY